LAKLSNFIPGAGIWLNTQRPEWNDANNALVGNGTSMVTLYYLRRYVTFCRELVGHDSDFSVSSEVSAFLDAVVRTLNRHRHRLAGSITDSERKGVLDGLGRAGSDYRRRIYAQGLSGRRNRVRGQHLQDFFGLVLDWINHSIHANRRTDGLYHSYNLVRFENRKKLPVRHLYEMLEGQVAVLSSGQLSAGDSLKVLTALKRSAMYRADQHSYLLYPDRQLPRFVEKNNIPKSELRRSVLLRRLLVDGDGHLIERDIAGGVHFHSSVQNARDIRRILDKFSDTRYARLAKRDEPVVLEIFERLFDHESFTGRSGTFYGYEGLGSIYWHMVSKLLLAVQETYFRAIDTGASNRVLKQLADAYYDIRAGIGDSKTPEAYGAFPMDPYSHTPGQGGARQPGLTGQVKEDFLCRFGELGVLVRGGEIHFCPRLLRRDELTTEAAAFLYHDVSGAKRRLLVKPGQLAFTYCQVPVLYRLGPRSVLTIVRTDGGKQHSDSLRLDAGTSREIFDRTGRIARIEVCLTLELIRQTR